MYILSISTSFSHYVVFLYLPLPLLFCQNYQRPHWGFISFQSDQVCWQFGRCKRCLWSESKKSNSKDSQELFNIVGECQNLRVNGQKVIYKPRSEIVKTLLQEWAAEVTVHYSGEKTLDAGLALPGSACACWAQSGLAAKKQAGPDYGADCRSWLWDAGRKICAAVGIVSPWLANTITFLLKFLESGQPIREIVHISGIN